MWNKFPETMPPDIPKTENFGIDYEVKYKLPNGKIKTTISEWLWEKKWNCIYPVIALREYSPIIPFRHWNGNLLGEYVRGWNIQSLIFMERNDNYYV